MALFYTVSPVQFYDDALSPPPAGAFPITAAAKAALFAGQAAGQIITATGATLGLAAPSLTPAQQAYALLNGGLALTSTGTPAVSGTYPVDPASQSAITSIRLQLAAGLGFPGGGSTLPWKDSAGNWHVMTSANFTAFAEAVSAFVQACTLVIGGYPGAALPSAAATIA